MTKRISEENQTNHPRRWQAHIDSLGESGLSRAEYCRQHNLSYHALNYWQRKLSRPSTKKTTLVPVTLPTALMRNGGQHNQAELQILLPGKISVSVGDNFSPVTLDRLLTVLENR
ncbi:MAG: hypothetical protein QNK25_15195 [Desulfobacterales bacterium]|nr:hypothetical protein [Desulfobacterales bacterium]